MTFLPTLVAPAAVHRHRVVDTPADRPLWRHVEGFVDCGTVAEPEEVAT